MRAHILVYGIVQGVGYRAFVKKIADFLKLSGSVKNLADGSVEICVEGPENLISLFLNRINITLLGGPDVFKIECQYNYVGNACMDLPSSFIIK